LKKHGHCTRSLSKIGAFLNMCGTNLASVDIISRDNGEASTFPPPLNEERK